MAYDIKRIDTVVVDTLVASVSFGPCRRRGSTQRDYCQ